MQTDSKVLHSQFHYFSHRSFILFFFVFCNLANLCLVHSFFFSFFFDVNLSSFGSFMYFSFDCQIDNCFGPVGLLGVKIGGNSCIRDNNIQQIS